MRRNKKSLIFFLGIVIAAVTTGCGWFGENAEPKNEAYESGKRALSKGKYEVAKAHFRRIEQSSPYYPQAVWMIQKVPFKKGLAAFEQKNYQIAVADLSKVPFHSPDYIEAQRYIDRSNYYILAGRFQKSSEIDRFILIHELVNISNKIGESKFLLDSLDMIKTGIDTSSSNKQTKDLINLLGSVVALNKKPEVHQKALNYLLTDFGQFYDQTEIRPQVLQIIGTLKMEHM